LKIALLLQHHRRKHVINFQIDYHVVVIADAVAKSLKIRGIAFDVLWNFFAFFLFHFKILLTLQNYERPFIFESKLLQILQPLVFQHLARCVLRPSAESSWILWQRFDYAIVFALHSVRYISVLILFVALKSKTVRIVVLTALRLQVPHKVVIWKNTIPLAWFPYDRLDLVGRHLTFHTFKLLPAKELHFGLFSLSCSSNVVFLLTVISKPAGHFFFQILLRFWFLRQRPRILSIIRSRGPLFLYTDFQRLHPQLLYVHFDIVIRV
jgi:hypothetical protein